MNKLETDKGSKHNKPNEGSDFELQQSKLLSIADKTRKNEKRILKGVKNSSAKPTKANAADRALAMEQSGQGANQDIEK